MMVLDDKPDVAIVPGIDRTGIVELVVKDHEAVRKLLAEYKRVMKPDEPDLADWGSKDGPRDAVAVERKQKVAWEVIRALSVHEVKEELVLYPAVRKRLGKKEVADEGLGEHHQLKLLLQELDGLPASDAGFDALMLRLINEATAHMDGEEQEVLPLLKANESDLELIELGRHFTNAAHTAPTRPHPAAPTTPPLATFAAAASKPVDAIKDAIRFHHK